MLNQHVLVIGGTGMLQDTTLWLLQKGYHVSVIGRTAFRHRKLQKQTSHQERLNSIMVNYYDTSLLLQKVKTAIQQYGPISFVVCWIRSDAMNSLLAICKLIIKTTHNQ